MIRIRKSDERGHNNLGWLDTRHSFSFDRYYDPDHMNFRCLRVLNEDRIAPGSEFPDHSHRDMEIISYVISGALEHRDNMGNGSVIRPGDVQYMCAGTGVIHAEKNPATDEPTHMLQIWILPDKTGHTPDYDQKTFAPEAKKNRLCLLVSPDGADGSIAMHQDARIFAALLDAGTTLSYAPGPERHVWLQVISGGLTVNDRTLQPGDAAAISEEPDLTVTAQESTECLLFDVP